MFWQVGETGKFNDFTGYPVPVVRGINVGTVTRSGRPCARTNEVTLWSLTRSDRAVGEGTPVQKDIVRREKMPSP